MNSQTALKSSELVERLPPLLRAYVQKHGIPDGMILKEAIALTDQEQLELIDTFEAVAESREGKTTPLRQFMAENGL